MYHMRESDKHFLWSMIGATGVILFWRGIWEGIGSLPFIENVWVSLFVGLAILTFSGAIFREFDPLGGIEKGALKMVHTVHSHPHKEEFTFRYYDKLQKKEIEVNAEHIKHIEKNVIAVHERNKEIFIPIHRVRAVHRKGEVIWRA
ncbi:TPA: DUF504 domain-containing protein [Candidatus Woesearchaeota archaeon]|nr:DUF504 domain-containing protein [Candidatus Woesearchaeota archaeon]